MSKLTFDASKVKPQVPLDPVPSDWYPVILTNTETKPTKAQAGKKAGLMLETEWTIIDGEFKGRKVFDRFNIENANPIAQEIGQQQLSALCHATGVFKFNDTKELHDKPHMLKVGLESERTVGPDGKVAEKGSPGSTTYEPRNMYKGVKPMEGAAAPAAAGGKALGWLKKDTPEASKPAEVAPAAKTPPGKKTAPVVAKTVVTRLRAEFADTSEFWVQIEEESADLKVNDVLEKIGQGMPLETAAMLQGSEEEKNGEWKTVGDYFEQVEETPAAEEKKAPPAKAAPATAAGGKPKAPWIKK